eukprot:CAMPEP_0184644604 /NCGR_PEP_ID=MMETSP0308-20130426/1304_1 /TAXON_ID=38269 /ORGANISM="Gloeochaete witrockiana, Strain SAG 46.84" /LENGTH=166 /DNA_ID=CAMNT_0027073235 /DNA_START=101 /DNA_END=601 /DNA_ORIENTATION=+
MNKRQMAHQVINLAMIVTSALMIWKGLTVLTNSESPIVVVLSASMEPGFSRGDLLFLYLDDRPLRTGDIVVYKIKGKEIPIVHRIIRAHEKADGRMDMLTKGDNNDLDDIGLYAPGQKWLNKDHIVGRAVAYVPYVGMLTILMNEHAALKIALIGLLGILVLTSKE